MISISFQEIRYADVFLHIFNHLHQNGKQVYFNSDKALLEHARFIEQRLLSKVQNGVYLQENWKSLDYETKYLF